MDRKPANAFIKARKGFCYLTVKLFGRHHEIMRVWGYKIDPDEKRQVRRLYPDVAFDWRGITQQLAEQREACRRYRTWPRKPAGRGLRDDGPLFGVYEPGTRTVFTNGVPPPPKAQEGCSTLSYSSTKGWLRLLPCRTLFERRRSRAWRRSKMANPRSPDEACGHLT